MCVPCLFFSSNSVRMFHCGQTSEFDDCVSLMNVLLFHLLRSVVFVHHPGITSCGLVVSRLSNFSSKFFLMNLQV